MLVKSVAISKQAAGAATIFLEVGTPGFLGVAIFNFATTPSSQQLETFLVLNPGDILRMRSDATSIAGVNFLVSGALLFGAPS